MGGTIAVIIREEDGKVHKMARWTNTFPYFVKNMKFINKDKRYLKEYLKVFYDMVKEYDEIIKNGGDFGIKMCDVYVPKSGHIAPIQYGIVVIDYQTDKILHCQGYSDFFIPEYEIEFPQTIGKNAQKINQELIDNRKVTYIEALKKEGAKRLSKLQIKYVEENGKITVLPKNNENLDLYYVRGYVLDLSPWKITRFKESEEGLNKLKNEIKSLGFEITNEDEKIWDEFISYHYN